MSGFRVLHVIEAMHQGGAESMVLEHIRHAGSDVETLVCALNRGGPAFEAARALGARVFVLEKGGRRLDGIRRLAALMRAERVTVVNGHNPTGGFYGAIAGSLAQIHGIVRTEHSIHYRGRHSGIYPHLLEPISTARSRRVICVCEAVRESHVRRLKWAANRYVTVLNGISSAPASRPRDVIRAELGLSPSDRVALTIGSLTVQKAQDVLIDGFARLASRRADAMLLIVGEGPLRADLEARARASGAAGRIRFMGARGDVGDLLAASDLFVLSSVREGLSITLLEAMRAERAVVATRIGGNAEAVSDGETGLIVPTRDPAALSAALEALLSDPRRATAMGAAGRERWARRFTGERMVAETEAVYRAAVEGTGVRLATRREESRPVVHQGGTA